MSRRSTKIVLGDLSPELKAIVENFLSISREQAKEGNFTGSLETLSQIFEIARDFPEALLLQACVNASRGKPELASKDLEKFALKCPSWPKTNPKLSGWVRREKNKVVGKSENRFYFLKDKFLFYYKEPLDTYPLSAFVIQNCLIAQDTLGPSKDPTQFSFVIPPNVNFIIDTFTTQSRAEWIAVLLEANQIDPFATPKKYLSTVEIENFINTYLLKLEPSSNSETSSDNSKNNKGLIQGYLYKRGQKNKDWKIRWFSLQGTLLSYSVSDETKPLAAIDVRNCQITQDEDDDAEHPFQIVTPVRTYYLDSEYSESTSAWIRAIYKIQASVTKIDVSSVTSDSSLPPSINSETGHPQQNQSKQIASDSRSSLQDSDSAPYTLHPDPSTRPPRQKYYPDRSNSLKAGHQIELEDLNPPPEVGVALATLNQTEEERRNRAAIEQAKSRRFDRTTADMLSEPLLSDDFVEYEGQSSSCQIPSCTIL